MVSPDNKEIENLIETKFYCSRRFAEEIESIAHTNKGMKYIDAIILLREEQS